MSDNNKNHNEAPQSPDNNNISNQGQSSAAQQGPMNSDEGTAMGTTNSNPGQLSAAQQVQADLDEDEVIGWCQSSDPSPASFIQMCFRTLRDHRKCIAGGVLGAIIIATGVDSAIHPAPCLPSMDAIDFLSEVPNKTYNILMRLAASSPPNTRAQDCIDSLGQLESSSQDVTKAIQFGKNITLVENCWRRFHDDSNTTEAACRSLPNSADLADPFLDEMKRRLLSEPFLKGVVRKLTPAIPCAGPGYIAEAGDRSERATTNATANRQSEVDMSMQLLRESGIAIQSKRVEEKKAKGSIFSGISKRGQKSGSVLKRRK